MIFYALKKRDLKTFYLIFILGIILYILYVNLEYIAPSLYNWMNFKVENRLESAGSSQGFIHHNLSSALLSFSNNPLFGSGIGAFSNSIYGKYEVHSTYFKMLGETGIIGSFAYLLFVIYLLQLVVIKQKKIYKNNPYYTFLDNLKPFFIGFFISWGYTYHLRKREFWILVAIIYIANSLMKEYNRRSNI